jgi:hypothetical protein
MNIIKAAAVQISPVLYSREGTVDNVLHRIIELGRHASSSHLPRDRGAVLLLFS